MLCKAVERARVNGECERDRVVGGNRRQPFSSAQTASRSRLSTMKYSLGALLLAATSTVYAAPLSPSRLILISRSEVEGTNSMSPPSCATFHSTVGAQTLYDVYHVSGDCERQLRRRGTATDSGLGDAGLRMLSVAIGRDNGEVSEGAEGVRDIAGLLYWLHPTTVETDSSLSSDSPSASSAQITFSSTNAALDTIPELEPMHLLDLPSKEGRLVLLSSDSTTADAQLSYMSSHPAYSQYSLVALPRLSTALDGPSPFPEVPAAAVNRVKAHLEGLTFQPLLSKVISGLDSEKELERMKRDVRTLSGEDQSRVKPSERVSLPASWFRSLRRGSSRSIDDFTDLNRLTVGLAAFDEHRRPQSSKLGPRFVPPCSYLLPLATHRLKRPLFASHRPNVLLRLQLYTHLLPPRLRPNGRMRLPRLGTRVGRLRPRQIQLDRV